MYKSAKWIAAAILSAGVASAAMAIPPGAGYYTINWGVDGAQRPSWGRRAQLVDVFDKYATGGRYESSDGNHNHVRLGAEIECENGNCGSCITTLKPLMRNKGIGVSPCPVIKRER